MAMTATGVHHRSYTSELKLRATEANLVNVGEYTSRESGFSVSISRPVFTDTVLGLNSRVVYTSYVQEPGVQCTFDDDGAIER